MLSQCPYPDCQKTFPVLPEFKESFVTCVYCGRESTFRSAERFARGYAERSRKLTSSPAPAALSDPVQLSALLEDIRSLWNVGSIFRTADGAGFARLYLCGITGCPPRKEIAKVSLGAEEQVQWQYHCGALDILPALRQSGILIVGLERSQRSELLTDVIGRGAIAGPLCLVVGNEVAGVSREALEFCDFVCHLPMRGIKESLNVAVAFGIAAYLLAGPGK